MLEELESTFLNFLYNCKQKFPEKNCKQIYGKSKASVWRIFKRGNGPQNLLVKSFAV